MDEGMVLMDYLKFNCHDLAVQNNELYEAHNKMQVLNDELADVVNALDPQIRSYEGLQNHLSAIKTSASDAMERLLLAANTLDRIVDVYYSAESKAMHASENLPVGVVQSKEKLNTSALPQASVSLINNKDLVLEDWLAELVYQYGKDEYKG